jgi:hypothetical protein
LFDKIVNDSGIIRVEEGKVDGGKFSKVLLLLGDRRRDPFRYMGLAREVSSRGVERGAGCHSV